MAANTTIWNKILNEQIDERLFNLHSSYEFTCSRKSIELTKLLTNSKVYVHGRRYAYYYTFLGTVGPTKLINVDTVSYNFEAVELTPIRRHDCDSFDIIRYAIE